MRLRFLFAVPFVLCGASASAQTPDARAQLTELYTLAVAVDQCDIALTDDQEERFGTALETAEERSGLSEAELEALFGQIETAAQRDKTAFCAAQRDRAAQAINALPQ